MLGMRVLVLGGYGLVGAAIVRRLCADGLSVIGHGRSLALGCAVAPDIPWINADLSRMTHSDDWTPYLVGVDAVVNAAGALQDGLRDDLVSVQRDAITALIESCGKAGVRRFIQISAPGAQSLAGTVFMRTKGEADAALAASALDWTIFRPGLVIGADSYGGTTLLRMLAAFPLLQPLAFGDRLVQTVSASDVAEAVSRALVGGVGVRGDFDLVEGRARRLSEAVAALRAWLGFAPARAVLSVPGWVAGAMGRVADTGGWLGWRSPLRTTALRVLRGGVIGDGAAWSVVSGQAMGDLSQTLRDLPCTAQERLFARAQLVFPVALIVLSGFWIASGVIGAVHWRAAAAVMANSPLAEHASLLVWLGVLLDLAVGFGLLVKRFARAAALGSVGVCALYLAAGTLLTPALWADPLGPFVKVFPAMGLGLVVAALLGER